MKQPSQHPRYNTIIPLLLTLLLANQGNAWANYVAGTGASTSTYSYATAVGVVAKASSYASTANNDATTVSQLNNAISVSGGRVR